LKVDSERNYYDDYTGKLQRHLRLRQSTGGEMGSEKLAARVSRRDLAREGQIRLGVDRLAVPTPHGVRAPHQLKMEVRHL
jgi:hypothetical protein